MRFPVITCPWLKVEGIALFPFIMLKNKTGDYSGELILHERIHLRQQLELLIFPFYCLYLLNYLVNILKYRNHDKAYRNIAFEREAYGNDKNRNYLKQRRFWSFLSYF